MRVTYGLRSKVNGNFLTNPLNNSHKAAFGHSNHNQPIITYKEKHRACEVGSVCYQGTTELVEFYIDDFGKLTAKEN